VVLSRHCDGEGGAGSFAKTGVCKVVFGMKNKLSSKFDIGGMDSKGVDTG